MKAGSGAACLSSSARAGRIRMASMEQPVRRNQEAKAVKFSQCVGIETWALSARARIGACKSIGGRLSQLTEENNRFSDGGQI